MTRCGKAGTDQRGREDRRRCVDASPARPAPSERAPLLRARLELVLTQRRRERGGRSGNPIEAADAGTPIQEAQLLTYMSISEKRVGPLINLNVKFLRDGIRPFVL